MSGDSSTEMLLHVIRIIVEYHSITLKTERPIFQRWKVATPILAVFRAAAVGAGTIFVADRIQNTLTGHSINLWIEMNPWNTWLWLPVFADDRQAR